MGKCSICGKNIGFFKTLVNVIRSSNIKDDDNFSFSVMCDSCIKKYKKETKKEREARQEEEKKIEEAKKVLKQKYGLYLQKFADTRVYLLYVNFFPNGKHIPKNRLIGGHLQITNEGYNLIVNEVSKDVSNAGNIIDEFLGEIVVNFEKEKIAEREKKYALKEKAEREYYGAIKTKRQTLDFDTKETIFSKFNYKCAICNATQGLHIHHKDENSSNNQMDNLLVLCGVCHKKIHMNVR